MPWVMTWLVLPFESVLIGAGEVGVEIEVAPIDLKFLTGGIVANIVKVGGHFTTEQQSKLV